MVRGWQDEPLSDKGKEEAEEVAERLQQYNPQYIYHSDFLRDSETAHIIGNKLNIPADTDYDLRTWDVGAFSGKPEKDVNPAIMEFYRKSWETPPGSGESFDGFAKRFIDCLENKMNMATIEGMRPIVIVTHGRNIALAHAHIEGIEPEDAQMPMPSSMAVISVQPDRSLSIEMEEPKEAVIDDI